MGRTMSKSVAINTHSQNQPPFKKHNSLTLVDPRTSYMNSSIQSINVTEA
jgi:hypothetical protein